jgi:hypothetical protein
MKKRKKYPTSIHIIIVWVTSSSSFWNSGSCCLSVCCAHTQIVAYDVRKHGAFVVGWMKWGMTTCSRELGEGKRFMPRWQFQLQHSERTSERVGKRNKKRRSFWTGWSFVCACGSIDDGDNKRADVSPRGLLCFPVLSFFCFLILFRRVLFFCFRPRSSLFFCRAGQT